MSEKTPVKEIRKSAEIILRSAQRLEEAEGSPKSPGDPDWKAFLRREVDILLRRVTALRDKLFGNGG